MTAAMMPAPDFCGCDAPETSGDLISIDVALSRGLALADTATRPETVPLMAAIGRVLAAPAIAPLPLPPFDNSAMDGYALRLCDLPGKGPWRLPVAGRIAAGDAPPEAGPDRPAVLRILTGAPAPAWVDAVVMQEHVRRDGDHIILDAAPEAGRNIRRRGEDLREGDAILPAGVLIGMREASALASTGAAEVQVHGKLRVAIFSTGSELRQPGEDLGPGQIWNSNRFMLRAALSAPWIELTDLGAVPDNPEALTETLVSAARNADIVVSTGGVSVGDEDHMPAVFRAAGGDIHAMRIAMKPGKPMAVGKMGDAIYLGLPGNPVSAFVTWLVIGAQIARKRAGLAEIAPRRTLVKAGFELSRRPGRCEMRPARITGTDGAGRQIVELLSPSFSARVALLANADGLAVLPGASERIRAGDLLEFMRLD